MNLTETLALLDKLKAVGAKHFKSADLQVDLEAQSWVHVDTLPDAKRPEPAAPVTEPYNAQNTKAVEDMIDLLKSKDEALLDKIFPAGA